jgi:hypothetical protein
MRPFGESDSPELVCVVSEAFMGSIVQTYVRSEARIAR